VAMTHLALARLSGGPEEQSTFETVTDWLAGRNRAMSAVKPYQIHARKILKLDALDGLLFSGGSDLDPELYGQETHAETADVVPERDRAEIAQDRACFDRSELIGVAEHDQARVGRHRVEEERHHREVHHRALVDHDDVGAERIIGPSRRPGVGSHPQRAVEGGGRVGHALGVGSG